MPLARGLLKQPYMGVNEWLDVVRCQAACAVHTDACGYVTAIAQGDYHRAYAIARERNPFVSVCGRICGAPCETACRRGLIDSPVPIRALKRFVTERHGIEAGGFSARRKAKTLDKVAVIGAGVGGLAAAHDLALEGYAVTVFEASPLPGGLLTYGVPLFRLERDVVGLEINSILELGIDLRLGQRLGRDFTLGDLRREGYRAILLAIGLSKGRKVPVSGADLPGVTDAIEFLHRFNSGSPPDVHRRVVVIGGGNVALDAARSARRLGQPFVAVICLESPSEMPATPVELRDALEEGISIVTSRGPKAILPHAGELVLQTVRCTSVFNAQGSFDPQFDASDIREHSADTIIFAVGQAADLSFLRPEDGIETERGLVKIRPETGQTSAPDVFAAGDLAHGPKLFINAIAGGQAAARGIHDFLRGRTTEQETALRWKRSFYRTDASLTFDRREPPLEPPERRVTSFSMMESVFGETEAREQADRCLRCNVQTIFDTSICIACSNCVKICPEGLIRILPVGRNGKSGVVGTIPPCEEHPEPQWLAKNESTCTRCALCAEACPTHAIEMREFTAVCEQSR